LLLGGLVLMLSMSELSQLSPTTSTVRLLVTFGLFGVGMGLVNSQISVAAVAGMPAGQAGLASGIASASRQLGQALGVAVAGSLLTARAGSLAGVSAAFGMATDPAWHLLFGGACLVTAAGLVTRRARPRHGVARGFLGVGRARSERHARTGELPRAAAAAGEARGSGLGVDSGSVFTFDHEEGAADHASQL
jgi:hypothetical protein